MLWNFLNRLKWSSRTTRISILVCFAHSSRSTTRKSSTCSTPVASAASQNCAGVTVDLTTRTKEVSGSDGPKKTSSLSKTCMCLSAAPMRKRSNYSSLALRIRSWLLITWTSSRRDLTRYSRLLLRRKILSSWPMSRLVDFSLLILLGLRNKV